MDSFEARRQLATLVEPEAPHRGDRLQAERALARRIGYCRETLQVALSHLEAEGVIWRHVGQGTFHGPAGVPLRETLLVAVTGPADLMETRLVIEPPVARAAATGGRRRDLGHLRRRVEAGRQAATSRPSRRPTAPFIARLPRRRAPPAARPPRLSRRRPAEFRGRHSDQHAAIVAADRGGGRRRGGAGDERIWRRSGPRWPRPGDGRGGEARRGRQSSSGLPAVSRARSMAMSATAAAATRYHAGASLLPLRPISQVATKGAVPPKSAFAALKLNAKPE